MNYMYMSRSSKTYIFNESTPSFRAIARLSKGGGGGGGAVHGHLADSTSGGWGGGAVCIPPIQPVGAGGGGGVHFRVN